MGHRWEITSDADIPPGEPMEFRLTYEGPLYGANGKDTRAKHKHDIRRRLHPQLKRLWDNSPFRMAMKMKHSVLGNHMISLLKHRVDNYQRCGYSFCPLVTDDMFLRCELEVLILKPDMSGDAALIRSGDIDNRIKTLFDALRLPGNKDELGGHVPQEGETPFFCLLEDDRLISKLGLETDRLLEPTSAENANNVNDARVVIKVRLWPFKTTMENIDFI